ncbi:DUF1232 domain-containing protein [uncultured Amnibacterium sp.]|uniref:DUF1232 domain-containing protein n=1 Tax=uncultured Amnibacterium sp. TaxID=1631851 RepID=UPI0035CCA44E
MTVRGSAVPRRHAAAEAFGDGVSTENCGSANHSSSACRGWPSPLDVIPDPIPGLGLSDDAAVVVAAVIVIVRLLMSRAAQRRASTQA